MSHWLSEQLPNARDVVELPVNELALRLLRLGVNDSQAQIFHRNSVTSPGTWTEQIASCRDDQHLQTRTLCAFGEAWDWLFFHGFIALRPREQVHTYATQRGEDAAADPHALAGLQASARLEVDLHARLAHRIRRQFILGEYDLAAFCAMREVEIRLRELSGAPSAAGQNLARIAFAEDGPLADKSLDRGEQKATSDLFAGAFGVFKNPPSHRQVEFDDPTKASEVILFSDLLLRMLDELAVRLEAGHRRWRSTASTFAMR